jgi:uncharacterized protein involved in exopolysaccharide biosynthesis
MPITGFIYQLYHNKPTTQIKTRSKLGSAFNTFKKSRNYFFLAFLAGAFLAGAFLAAGFFLAAAISLFLV